MPALAEPVQVVAPPVPAETPRREAPLTAAWVQDVLRATLDHPGVVVRRCPGDGECVHDRDRWFWSFDRSEALCGGRGHATLARLVLSVHQLFGRLVVPSDAGIIVPTARAARETRPLGEVWRLLRLQDGREEVVCEGSRGKCWITSRKLEVLSLSQRDWSVPVNGAQYRLGRAPATSGAAPAPAGVPVS